MLQLSPRFTWVQGLVKMKPEKPTSLGKFLEEAEFIDEDYKNDYSIYEKDGKYYRIKYDEYGFLPSTFVEVVPIPTLTYVYMSRTEIEEEEKKGNMH